MEYTDYDLNKLACEKLLGIDFSVQPYQGLIDPLNNGSILISFISKYEVDINHYESNVSIASDYTDKPPIAKEYFHEGDELPRAIITCILKSESII